MVSEVIRDRKTLVKLIRRRKKRLVFLRNVWWKFAKFENNSTWRKPKGKDNPMRLRLKGHPPVVISGYRTPNVIRGLHPKGLRPVVIHNVSELSKFKPDEVIIYLGSNVSLRKRLEILSRAKDQGFLIANDGV